MGCGASKATGGTRSLRVDSYRDNSPEAVNETLGCNPSPPVSEEGSLTVDLKARTRAGAEKPLSIGTLEKKHNSLLDDWEKQKLVRQNSVRSASVERQNWTLTRSLSPSPSFTEARKPAPKKSPPEEAEKRPLSPMAQRRAGWVD